MAEKMAEKAAANARTGIPRVYFADEAGRKAVSAGME
jgi:hypothetical protein